MTWLHRFVALLQAVVSIGLLIAPMWALWKIDGNMSEDNMV